MTIKRSNLFISLVLLFIAALTSGILLPGCGGKNGTPGDEPYTMTGNIIEDGKNLMQLRCAKCHELVPVNALTKDVWLKASLPSMSHYFGIAAYLGGYFIRATDTPKMKMEEWDAMVEYIKKAAPDTLLPAKTPLQPINDWAGFSLKAPPEGKNVVFTSLAAINPYNRKLYTADRETSNLSEWDSNLAGRNLMKLPWPATSAIFQKNGSGESTAILSCIGELLPMDFKNGKLINVNLGTTNTNQTVIASELNRPIQTISADFNKDGLTDLVVCNEGNLKGGVDVYLQNKDHTYTGKTISTQTGAVQAIAGDFDHDGWTDLMVLFGTANEGLYLFTNDHNGGFTSKNLISFPPVYGSSSFQLADIDHDGNPDLVYTCGYNFRNSRILKPYHGLYIYKNTGNWNFQQKWFYPINGCTKAIAADFDGDGDLDIMTTAFFADLKNNPAEGCIYFENDKPFSFKPHTIPVSKYGRWFAMDVADYNGDGKPDVVLGNYADGFGFQGGFTPFWNNKLPFIILENKFSK